MKRITLLLVTILLLTGIVSQHSSVKASDPYYVKATIGRGSCSTSGFSVDSSLTWHLPPEVLIHRTFWLNSTLVFEERFLFNPPSAYMSFPTMITPGGPTASAGFPTTLPYTYTIVQEWYVKSVHISTNIRKVYCSVDGVKATVENIHSFPY